MIKKADEVAALAWWAARMAPKQSAPPVRSWRGSGKRNLDQECARRKRQIEAGTYSGPRLWQGDYDKTFGPSVKS